MQYPILLLLMLVVFAACKNEANKEVTPAEENTTIVQLLENPAEGNSKLPRLFSNGTELYFSWVTHEDSTDILNYSLLNNSNWQPVTEIVRGNDWFTNWADFPVIAENNGHILTSYLQKSASGTYTYDVMLNLYNAETKSWKKGFILHDDGTQSEHGFVSIRPYVGDSFFITWLDGRETVGKGHGGGQMTLRGAIVFKDGTIDYDTLIDERVCDCCPTSAAIGTNDELIVAYRDRSSNEIRDISIARWEKEAGWIKPFSLGNDQWKIAGCPVNGPAIDAHESFITAAWFTAAKGEGDILVSFSEDNGETFSRSYRVDAGNATGRVDVSAYSNEEAAVIWMQPKGDKEVINLMKINKHGYTGHPIEISETSAERASGFPQMELVGDMLYLAWTHMAPDDITRIKMAKVPLSEL